VSRPKSIILTGGNAPPVISRTRLARQKPPKDPTARRVLDKYRKSPSGGK
jgi:hypothetical protein